MLAKTLLVTSCTAAVAVLVAVAMCVSIVMDINDFDERVRKELGEFKVCGLLIFSKFLLKTQI